MHQESMKAMARRLWGTNRNLRRKWFGAIRTLRHHTRGGWIADRRVARVEIQPTHQEQRA